MAINLSDDDEDDAGPTQERSNQFYLFAPLALLCSTPETAARIDRREGEVKKCTIEIESGVGSCTNTCALVGDTVLASAGEILSRWLAPTRTNGGELVSFFLSLQREVNKRVVSRSPSFACMVVAGATRENQSNRLFYYPYQPKYQYLPAPAGTIAAAWCRPTGNWRG